MGGGVGSANELAGQSAEVPEGGIDERIDCLVQLSTLT
jgi:hypothetical protein